MIENNLGRKLVFSGAHIVMKAWRPKSLDPRIYRPGCDDVTGTEERMRIPREFSDILIVGLANLSRQFGGS